MNPGEWDHWQEMAEMVMVIAMAGTKMVTVVVVVGHAARTACTWMCVYVCVCLCMCVRVCTCVYVCVCHGDDVMAVLYAI